MPPKGKDVLGQDHIALLRAERAAAARPVAPAPSPRIGPAEAQTLRVPPAGGGRSIESFLDDVVASPAAEPAVPGAAAAARQPVRLPLARIDDSPHQPRLAYGARMLADRAHSLREHGLRVPVNVRPRSGGRYELIDGHCRVRAARLVGWAEIDAYVDDVDDAQAVRLMGVAAEAHTPLCDYERARLYSDLRAVLPGRTWTAVAAELGVSSARVSQCVAMLELPASVRAVLDRAPRLLDYRAADVLRTLLSRTPGHETQVVEVLEALHSQAGDDPVSAARVRAALAQRLAAAPAADAVDARVVVDRHGRPAFRTRARGTRELVVTVLDPARRSAAWARIHALLEQIEKEESERNQ